jgi:hypothetical protein
MPEVRLVDLDVIKRFSLAVRRDSVPAEELLESLDASRAVVEAAMRGSRRSAATPSKAAAPSKTTRKAAATGKAPKKAATATRRRAPGS